MKSILFFLYSLLAGQHSFAGKTFSVDENLLRSFSDRFPDAQQVAWVEAPTTYTVNFVEYGIRSHIVYDKKGFFISSTRYYDERNLPYYLFNILKKRFTGKTIYAVTEQTTETGVEYYVKLQDSKVWMTIWMDGEGDLNVVEKYHKAS
jgi:hypothetical protein